MELASQNQGRHRSHEITAQWPDQDSHNLLWNWAFTTLDVDLDEDNNNDIPDFAEFEYTIVPEQTQTPQNGLLRTMSLAPTSSNSQAEHHFVPIVIEIPQHVDLTAQDTTLKFYYAGSDPEQVEIKKDQDDPSGNKKDYTPAPGNMRLWTKDANKKRNPKAYQASGSGGDYLVPEQAYNINALLATNALNPSEPEANNRTLIIYAEAISATENRGAALTTILTYTHTSGTGKETKKEERSVNGLTNQHNPFQAVAALPKDFSLDLAYSVDKSTPPIVHPTFYSIGGVRLKLSYNLNSLTREDRSRLDKITWTFNQAGRLCEDLKVFKDNKKADGKAHCTDLAPNAEHSTQGDKDEDHTIYWEPTVWTTDLDAILTTKTHYKEGQDTMVSYKGGQSTTVDYTPITQTLAIKTRELGPKPAGQEYRGNDVKMLEQMLWQLGMSPNADKKPGVSATRLAESKRNVLESTASSVARMIGRFNYTNFSYVASGKVFGVQSPSKEERMGKIDDYPVITRLKEHWLHYLHAYQTHQGKTPYSFDDIPKETVRDIVKVFDGGDIRYSANYQVYNGSFTVKPTYTEDVHKEISRYKTDFKREDLLKAFATKEAYATQWGYNKQAARITTGGADELGSKGFNQIQNAYAYGARSGLGTKRDNGSYCYPVSAYSRAGESIVNHYDPIENLKAKAIFLTFFRGDCGRSFYYAFGNHAKKEFTYRAAINTQRTLMARQTGNLIDSKPSTNVASFLQDDAYELLAKGIGGYNQGTATFNNTQSWIDTLITTAKGSGSVATAIEYALDILHSADKGIVLPYRTYIWKGGVYPATTTDDKGKVIPHPDAGQDWCFGYGEKQWLDGKTFEAVQVDAVGDLTANPPIQPVGRIDCQTGTPL